MLVKGFQEQEFNTAIVGVGIGMKAFFATSADPNSSNVEKEVGNG